MNFKQWLLFSEAKFDPNIIKPYKNGTFVDRFDLDLDDQGNVIPHNHSNEKSYITIDPKKKSITSGSGYQRLSPQSTKFHRIIKALKSKYQDIEDWEVQVRRFEPANKFSRTVGYWLSRPEIRLANKMPKYLYHGTSTNLWYEGIKQKGLVPRNITGSSGSFGAQNISALSYDNLVYLSTDPDASTRSAAKQASENHGGKQLIIRIDTKGLDPNKLQPDEDSGATTAQASIDVMSTLAYEGKIPSNNLEPFLFKTNKNWEKFYDIPVEEHPVTKDLKTGRTPDHGTPNYYALKDAGLIDKFRKILIDPKNITDTQVKNIIKNATWTQNVIMILSDLGKGNGILNSRPLEGIKLSKESLENPIVKMLVKHTTLREDEDKEEFAISLAKELGKKNFKEEVPRTIQEIKQQEIEQQEKIKENIRNLTGQDATQHVQELLHKATNKDEMAELIIENKPELYDYDILYLLVSASAINKDKIAELIIKNKPELSSDNVYQILIRANDKNKIAERLGAYNISKLNDYNIKELFDYPTNRQKMVLIINKYHTKKNSEIKRLIDKYLYEL